MPGEKDLDPAETLFRLGSIPTLSDLLAESLIARQEEN
jgi:hypothetical protein